MSRLLYRLGRFGALHPWRVIGLWLVALVAVAGLAFAAAGEYHDDYEIPGSGAQRASDLLAERFPDASGADARVVAHTEKGTISAAALAEATKRLDASRGVSSVAPTQFNGDRDTALLNVQYDIEVTEFKGTEGLDDLRAATKPLRDAGYTVEFGGQVPENILEPGGAAEALGIGAALIILLVAFGALLAAGVPLVIAAVGLVVGLSGVGVLAAFTDISTITPTLATMIGLGVGIDYALFVLTRHRQELAAGKDVPEAAGRANATAGLAVFFAGVTVLLAICGLAFTGLPVFLTMGFGTAIVVAATVVTALTLLPALFGLLGMRVFGRRQRARLAEVRKDDGDQPRWVERQANRVGRRPWAWALAALVLLLALAAPALSMRTWPSDAGSEPTSNTVRRAYDLIADNFGAGHNGPLLVVVDLKRYDAAALPGLVQRLGDVDGVREVSPPTPSPGYDAAIITVIPDYGPQDDRMPGLVHRIRDDALPPGAGVTGLTAVFSDMTDLLSRNLWKVIVIVVATSFVLLVLMFRSLVVPLKAAVMNMLSIGAAYGAVTAIFQWGWGVKLLGLPHEVPVSSYLPVMIFTMLFGLSMDYEVFLMSRVRERWLATGDARAATVSGLSSTARVITSAALIMVAVFLGFALDPNVTVKMMGVGLAVAIAVDATVVRLVLVPAVMALLGRAAWWLPRGLDRVLPHLDHDESIEAGVRAEGRQAANA